MNLPTSSFWGAKRLQNHIPSLILTTIYSILNTPTAYAADGVYETDVAGLDWILILLQNVLSVALRLIGIAAFVMLVIGSYKMLMSSGDPKAMQSAKSTIGLAIGGLVVAALAFILFQFLSEITGVKGILEVSIPTLD